MYPHQKYTNVFVSDIFAQRKPNYQYIGTVRINYAIDEIISNSDIVFESVENYRAQKYTCTLFFVFANILLIRCVAGE